MDTFEDLKCWQAGYHLKKRIRNEAIPLFPTSEKYELISQIIRASRSVTANIAEGWGRFHFLDSRKFFFNSRGSLGEILDHLIEARDCYYITEELYLSLRSDCTTALKILNGYIRYLTDKNNSEKKKPNSQITDSLPPKPNPHLP